MFLRCAHLCDEDNANPCPLARDIACLSRGSPGKNGPIGDGGVRRLLALVPSHPATAFCLQGKAVEVLSHCTVLC